MDEELNTETIGADQRVVSPKSLLEVMNSYIVALENIMIVSKDDEMRKRLVAERGTYNERLRIVNETE